MTESRADCPFCAIIRGERSADVVYRDEAVVAFLDKRPVFPGHVLVVPVRHLETLADLPDDLAVPLTRVVRAVSVAMESGLAAEGSFVAQNNKVSQSVPHLHVHVIPRRHGDGLRGFFWPRIGYKDDEERRAAAELLRSAIAAELEGLRS